MGDIDTIPSRLPDLEPPTSLRDAEPPRPSRLPWLLALLAVLFALMFLVRR